MILAGILAPWIAPFDPVLDADLMNSELPPDATFWFGTDGQGRDVYTASLRRANLADGRHRLAGDQLDHRRHASA